MHTQRERVRFRCEMDRTGAPEDAASFHRYELPQTLASAISASLHDAIDTKAHLPEAELSSALELQQEGRHISQHRRKGERPRSWADWKPPGISAGDDWARATGRLHRDGQERLTTTWQLLANHPPAYHAIARSMDVITGGGTCSSFCSPCERHGQDCRRRGKLLSTTMLPLDIWLRIGVGGQRRLETPCIIARHYTLSCTRV